MVHGVTGCTGLPGFPISRQPGILRGKMCHLADARLLQGCVRFLVSEFGRTVGLAQAVCFYLHSRQPGILCLELGAQRVVEVLPLLRAGLIFSHPSSLPALPLLLM